jgi:hypothetical protein
MPSTEIRFSSVLSIEIYTKQIAAATKTWDKFDLGPGIFHIPSEHIVMIRIRNENDEFLKQLVAEIKDLDFVKALNLSENRKITNKGLQTLVDLQQIRILNLSSCDISDRGLESLTKLRNLQQLDISFCNRITDAGIRELKSLSKLEYVDIRGIPKITNGSLSKIRRSDLTIHR